jgi:quercetin dioxygenase-like cupin family protein
MSLANIASSISTGLAALAASSVGIGSVAATDPSQAAGSPRNGELWPVSKDSATSVGEPLAYPATPKPEVSSFTMSIAPNTTTRWMTHPVPAYLYVLEGTLTVEFAAGPDQTFKAGQAFLQAQTKWHRGRNDGKGLVRFLAVFIGAADVPNVLRPPEAGNQR